MIENMILHMSKGFILETNVERGGNDLSAISHHQVQPDDAHQVHQNYEWIVVKF